MRGRLSSLFYGLAMAIGAHSVPTPAPTGSLLPGSGSYAVYGSGVAVATTAAPGACAAGQHYSRAVITSSNCDTARSMASASECEAAARQLGIHFWYGTTASIPSMPQYYPPGCSFGFNARSGDAYSLTWNSGAAAPSAGSVQCSDHQRCLCGGCVACPSGTFTDEANDGESCSGTACAAGTYGPTGAENLLEATCTACPAGEHQPMAGQGGCESCAMGKYQDQAGQRYCNGTRCAAGRWAHVGQSAPVGNCTACEVGQYGAVFEVISSGQCSDEAVVTTADECAAAAAALAGAKTEQHNAMSGMYHYGSYGSGSAHVAESAAPGHVHVISAAYYPRGCFIDDDGRISFNSYSNSAGSASGVHGSSYGSSYGNYGGSSFGGGACTSDILCACVDLRHNQSAGFCKACPVGKFSNTTSQGNCHFCPQGQTGVNVIGGGVSEVTACAACPTGQYQEEWAQTTCKNCRMGKYQNMTGQTSCSGKLCSSGRWFEVAQTQPVAACKACAAGKYRKGAVVRTSGDACPGDAMITTKADCITAASALRIGYTAVYNYSYEWTGSSNTACWLLWYPHRNPPSMALYFEQGVPPGKSPGPSSDYPHLCWDLGDHVGAQSCRSCMMGKFQAHSGRANCNGTVCPAGRWLDLAQTAPVEACTACGVGTAREAFQTANSSRCPDGATITTVEDCRAAAPLFGIDLNRTSLTRTSQSWLPPGCFVDYGKLYFNDWVGAVGWCNPPLRRCACHDLSSLRDSGECAVCPAGHFQPILAQPECEGCPAGQHQDETGQTECKGDPCPPGQHLNLTAQTQPVQCLGALCDAGKYFERLAQTVRVECKICATGWFAAETGEQTCEACGAGQFTVRAGGTVCVDCANPAWCVGGGNCTAGRTGVGCSVCKIGYYPLQGDCALCPETDWAFLVLLIPAGLLGWLVLRKMRKAIDAAADEAIRDGKGGERADEVLETVSNGYALLCELAALMTLLNFMQLSTNIVSMNFDWPLEVTWINNILRQIAELDLVETVAPECMATKDQTQGMLFELKFFGKQLLPLIPVLLLIALNQILISGILMVVMPALLLLVLIDFNLAVAAVLVSLLVAALALAMKLVRRNGTTTDWRCQQARCRGCRDFPCTWVVAVVLVFVMVLVVMLALVAGAAGAAHVASDNQAFNFTIQDNYGFVQSGTCVSHSASPLSKATAEGVMIETPQECETAAHRLGLYRAASNMIYHGSGRATCCDRDGNCYDGTDDWCCDNEYFCSNNDPYYAKMMGGNLCSDGESVVASDGRATPKCGTISGPIFGSRFSAGAVHGHSYSSYQGSYKHSSMAYYGSNGAPAHYRQLESDQPVDQYGGGNTYPARSRQLSGESNHTPGCFLLYGTELHFYDFPISNSSNLTASSKGTTTGSCSTWNQCICTTFEVNILNPVQAKGSLMVPLLLLLMVTVIIARKRKLVCSLTAHTVLAMVLLCAALLAALFLESLPAQIVLLLVAVLILVMDCKNLQLKDLKKLRTLKCRDIKKTALKWREVRHHDALTEEERSRLQLRIARVRGALTSAALGAFLLAFTLMVGTATTGFDCFDVGGDSYLAAYPAEQCYSTDGEVNTFAIAAWGAIVLVVCVLSLIWLGLKLRFNQSKLRTDRVFLRAYGTLYLRYEKKYYYWELLVLFRKLLLVLLANLFQDDPIAQVVGAGVIMGVSLVLQIWCQPFLSDDLDVIEIALLSSCCGLVILGAISLKTAVSKEMVFAMYVVVLVLTVIRCVYPLKRIWRGDGDLNDTKDHDQESDDNPTSESPPSRQINFLTSTTKHSKKMIV